MDIDQVIDAKSFEFGFDKPTTLSIAELVSHIDNIKKRKKTPLSNLLTEDRFFSGYQSAALNVHPKGVSLESHYHNFVEINYVYKGCCYQTINDKVEIVLNEGDMLLLDSGTVHSIKVTSTDDVILNCMISERYFAHYLIDKVSSNTFLNELATRIMFNSKSTYHIFRTNNNPSLRDYFQHCVKEYFYPSICSENVIDAYIMLIFSVLCRINYEQNELDKNHAAILGILNYIEKHSSYVSLQDVAKHFHFSSNYLSAYLKKHLNKTYIEIIQEIRLKKSYALLVNTSKPIEKISSEVGYSNTYYFSNLFKKKYGQTPSYIRREVRQNP